MSRDTRLVGRSPGGYLAIVFLMANTVLAQGSKPSPSPPFKTFFVEVLSRGTGVPPEAREALLKVRALIEEDKKQGMDVKVESKRIGIEGETRLCAAYAEAKDAAHAFDRSHAIVKGIDLVNLVAKPCPQPSPGDGSKEKKSP